MRGGIALFAAATCATACAAAPALCAPLNRAVAVSHCATTVALGEPAGYDTMLKFSGTVEVACPPGVSFSLGLTSAHACAFRSADGSTFDYELFADAAMQTAILSCRRAVTPLRGIGRRTFLIYGRAAGGAAGSGRFNDALLATITT